MSKACRIITNRRPKENSYHCDDVALLMVRKDARFLSTNLVKIYRIFAAVVLIPMCM